MARPRPSADSTRDRVRVKEHSQRARAVRRRSAAHRSKSDSSAMTRGRRPVRSATAKTCSPRSARCATRSLPTICSRYGPATSRPPHARWPAAESTFGREVYRMAAVTTLQRTRASLRVRERAGKARTLCARSWRTASGFDPRLALAAGRDARRTGAAVRASATAAPRPATTAERAFAGSLTSGRNSRKGSTGPARQS